MTIIWGVQGAAKGSQSNMVERTKRYIEYLADKNEKIMIPAPALTEYLVGFSPAKQKEQSQVIERNFIVPSFDIAAVGVAAELLGNTKVIQEMRIKGEYDKVRVSIDAQIIAIAIVNHAEKIVSHDPKLTKLANERIVVEEVPVIQTQLKMGFE
jgi:predicted nucleic acid-binding protein